MGGGGGCRGGRWADRQMERDTNTEDLFRWAIAFHEGLQTDDLASRKIYYSRWYGERVTEKESEKRQADMSLSKAFYVDKLSL